MNGSAARLRCIVRPGSDLFLVCVHNCGEVEGVLSTITRGLTTKVNDTRRF